MNSRTHAERLTICSNAVIGSFSGTMVVEYDLASVRSKYPELATKRTIFRHHRGI